MNLKTCTLKISRNIPIIIFSGIIVSTLTRVGPYHLLHSSDHLEYIQQLLQFCSEHGPYDFTFIHVRFLTWETDISVVLACNPILS